jgi:hypothetical protein
MGPGYVAAPPQPAYVSYPGVVYGPGGYYKHKHKKYKGYKHKGFKFK